MMCLGLGIAHRAVTNPYNTTLFLQVWKEFYDFEVTVKC